MSDNVVAFAVPLSPPPDYKGHQIRLNFKYLFEVSGPLLNNPEGPAFAGGYASLHEAHTAINAAVEAAEKQHRASTRLALELLDSHGKLVTVKGIHAGQGTLLGTDLDVYPYHPKLARMLAEHQEAAARQTRLASELSKFRIGRNRRHGRVRVDQYDGLIEALVREIEAKTTKANAELGEV
jgi:hypothetical protein